MTQPVKDEDQHDADFEKVSSEQKSLTFSLSYSLVEKAVKIIIVVAILVCISVYIGKRMNEGEGTTFYDLSPSKRDISYKNGITIDWTYDDTNKCLE